MTKILAQKINLLRCNGKKVSVKKKIQQPGIEPGAIEWESMILPLNLYCEIILPEIL